MVEAELARVGRSRRVALALPHFHSVGRAVAEGGWLAAVPVQLAEAVKDALGLAVYRLPMPVPVPEISLYWHARHSAEPAHCWMRRQVLAANADLGFAAMAGPV